MYGCGPTWASPPRQTGGCSRWSSVCTRSPSQDALETVNNPKVETYSGILHVVLHGIDFLAESDTFETHDTDFFLTRTFLITVHDGKRRSIQHIQELCRQNHGMLQEGPTALMHRIVDTMVDHYRPEVEELAERLDQIEETVLERPSDELTRRDPRDQARHRPDAAHRAAAARRRRPPRRGASSR